MSSIQERYSELVALTKRYLLNEYALPDRIFSEPETYNYFRSYAQQRQSNKISPTETKHKEEIVPTQKTILPQTSISQVPKQAYPTLQIKKSLSPSIPLEKKDNFTEKTTKAEIDKVVLQKNENALFTLEPPPALQIENFSDLRKIIQEKLPQIHLIESIPDDSEAQKLSKAWMQERKIPQVIILSFDETFKHLTFLGNIAKTIELFGITAKVVNATKLEVNKEWEQLLQSPTLKLVLASSSGFYNLPELQKKYREEIKQGRHYLGDCLLLLLSDISFYLKEPALKSSLWAALKQLLASIPPLS